MLSIFNSSLSTGEENMMGAGVLRREAKSTSVVGKS
jgi:hypothetical protein